MTQNTRMEFPFLKVGGYEMLKKSLKLKPEEIGEEVLKSGVRDGVVLVFQQV